jgi:photosystem II stability/assembly factor-like uncharacterized protein
MLPVKKYHFSSTYFVFCLPNFACMKTTLMTKILVILFVGCCELAQAQWSNISPFGGMVYDVAGNGTITMCITDAGVFRSTDNGIHWTPANTGLPVLKQAGIGYCMSGSRFLVSNPDGVFQSVDGNNWTFVNINLNAQSNGKIPFFSTSGFTYAGLSSKLWRSSDCGTFVNSSGNMTSPVPELLSIANGNLYMPNNSVTIWVSTNNGTSWSSLPGSAIGTQRGMTVTPDYIYSFHNKFGVSGLYRRTSQIGGGAFELVSTNLPNKTTLSNMMFTNGKLYAVINQIDTTSNISYELKLNSIVSSTDGQTWTSARGNMPPTSIFNLKSINNIFYAMTRQGLFVSSDFGITWELRMNNIRSHTIYAMLSTPNALFASVGSISGTNGVLSTEIGGLIKSMDNGVTWMNTGLKDSIAISKMYFNNGNLFLVAKDAYANTPEPRIYRSSDMGDTWQMLGVETKNATSMAFNNQKIAATTYSTITSTNNGDTWETMPTTLGLKGLTYLNNNLFGHNGLYTSAAGTGGIFKSTDDGLTWNPSNEGISNNLVINTIKTAGNNLFAFHCRFTLTTGQPLFKSSDGGQTWNTSATSSGQYFLSFNYSNGTHLYTTGTERSNFGYDTGSVFLSADAGNIWTNIGNGLPRVSYYSTVIHNQKIFVGTLGHGIWSSDLSNFVAVKDPMTGKIKAEVSVYPNPAAPNASLFIQMTGAPSANIRIFNLMGEAVRQSNLSETTNQLNRDHLPAGIYFYSVLSGGEVIAKGKWILE